MKLSLLAAIGGALIIASGSLAWAALTNHPELNTAYQQVETARKTLNTAHNGKKFFGGHLEEAEKLLNQAMTQISLAGQYADQHPAK